MENNGNGFFWRNGQLTWGNSTVPFDGLLYSDLAQFLTPHPPIYCATDAYSFSSQALPVLTKMDNGVDWLSDAPMPFEEGESSQAPPRQPNSLRDLISDSPKSSSEPVYHDAPFNPPNIDPWPLAPPSPPRHHPGMPLNAVRTADADDEEEVSDRALVFPMCPHPSGLHFPPPIILKPDDPRLKSVVHVRAQDEFTVQREIPVSDSKDRPWIRIFYYELQQRIAGPFEGKGPSVTIDGAHGPATDIRMSLSAVPTAKNTKSGTVRNQVGEGVRISKKGDNVVLTLLSDQPTFIQSALSNHCEGRDAEAVVRLQNLKAPRDENGKWGGENHKTFTLFDKKLFDLEMSRQAENPSDEGLTLLQSFGSCRIGFIKGFGAGYTRQCASTTPCWLEIYMSDPLEAYDAFARAHSDVMSFN